MGAQRYAEIERETNETRIKVRLRLDGSGQYDIRTGVNFLDHMLAQVSRHGFFDVEIEARGDLEVDCHHTAEDIGIALGQAFSEALGDKEGISRYGSAFAPMDEALALCALDFSGRPYLSFDCNFTTPRLGDLDAETVEEFFRAFSVRGGCAIHIKVLSGKNNHHIAEAVFKAFAQSCGAAASRDLRVRGARSTKGSL